MPERKARPIACYAKQPATDYDHHCSHSLHTKNRVAKKKTLTSLIKEATNLQGKKKTPDRWKHTKEMRDRDPLLVLLFLRGPSAGRASLACTKRGRRQTEHEAPGLGFRVKEREIDPGIDSLC
jgi:hypothetical protein